MTVKLKCQRCESEFRTTSGLITKCPECMRFCRKCDNPIENYTRAMRLCQACKSICSKCGVNPVTRKGGRAGGMCSPCQAQPLIEREKQARIILGSSCARCGIVHPLQWDHINNDPKPAREPGRKRASARLTEQAEFKFIIEHGYSSRLQLLCPNCNWLKHWNRDEYDQSPTYGPLICASKI